MTRLKLLIFGLFLLALATGVMVGMGMARSTRQHDTHSPLSEELGLSPEQNQAIRKIWSDMLHGPGQKSSERRHELQKERDQAVTALLNDQQKVDYAVIQENFNKQMAELSKEREQQFQSAVEQTKAILTDAQRVKYEALMKQGFHGPPWDHGESGHGTAPWHGAATMPATQPAENAATTEHG